MAEHDGEGDLTLEELRDIRDFMLTARDRMYTPRQGGERSEFYECCWCRATGGWPSEIAHRPVTSEGGARHRQDRARHPARTGARGAIGR